MTGLLFVMLAGLLSASSEGSCTSQQGTSFYVQSVTDAKEDIVPEDFFYDLLLERSVIVEVSPAEIIPAQGILPPPASSQEDTSVRREFINEKRNARIPADLPEGAWQIKNSVDFDDGFAPTLVLASGNRFLVQGEAAWNLYTQSDMVSIKGGYLASGNITIDHKDDVFYLQDSSGTLLAHQLDTGELAVMIPTMSSEGFEPYFIARRDQRIIAFSHQREPDAHAGERPVSSRLEVIHLGDPQELDAEGWLMSALTETLLEQKTADLPTALHRNQFFVAIENALVMFSPNLQLQGMLQGTFKPISLSLDENGQIYLLVDREGSRAFWLVTPEGKRLIEYTLPLAFQNARRPVAIGFDHSSYIISQEKVLKLDFSGELVWEGSAPSSLIGAFISLDNQLVGSVASEVGMFDAQGKWRPLYELEEETVQTPPILSSDGQIVVATNRRLIALSTR